MSPIEERIMRELAELSAQQELLRMAMEEHLTSQGKSIEWESSVDATIARMRAWATGVETRLASLEAKK